MNPGKRVFGQDRGGFTLPQKLDAPRPEEVLDEFERCDELLASGNAGGTCQANGVHDQGDQR
jgi:hypothetical protein